MTEVDLLKRSSFDWVDLFGPDDALMAAGFTAWGGVFGWQGVWYAVGGRRGAPSRPLAIGERMVCLAAADDWLNEHETDESAIKTKAWLRQSPTVFIAVALGGIAVTIYARLDDWKRGQR